jgi:hypothetical protein
MKSPSHPSTIHPAAELLRDFVNGQLDDTLSAAIEAHIEQCKSCCQLLVSISREQDPFIKALASAVDLSPGDTSTSVSARAGPHDDTPSETASHADLPASIGRFQIREQLGCGGFGIVLRATDPRLQRELAIKIPRGGAFLTDELRQRFVREAQAAAALDHANIVSVYEAGEEAGVCYIASAYCRGLNLSTWLKAQQKPVPISTAAWLIETLAEAVAHAHPRGALHRDGRNRSPSNASNASNLRLKW